MMTIIQNNVQKVDKKGILCQKEKTRLCEIQDIVLAFDVRNVRENG